MNVKDDNRLKILFLCTGNSCRSQMAEGFVRHLRGDDIEAYSAGVAPKGIDPRAIKVMSEVGIDISEQGSKSIEEIRHVEFDYVVTLCDKAQQSCPSFPEKTRVIHVGFQDPPKLASISKNEEEAKIHYRRIRDEIRDFVVQLPESLLNAQELSVPDQQRQFQTGIKSFLEQLPGELTEKKSD